jgi:hypothetical protein
MSLVDDLANHLESSLSLFTTFKIDVLSEEDNALTIRRYQSGSSLDFLDDGRDDTIGVQILSKNKNQQLAVETLENIVDYLYKTKNIPNDGSYQYITTNIYIQPILVEKTDRDSYLYSTLLQIIIHKN